MDVAAAQEVFATRQRMGKAVIGRVHALKVRALAKLSEQLKRICRKRLARRVSVG